MSQEKNITWTDQLYDHSPALLKKTKVDELLRVYQDLERVLKDLTQRAEKHIGSNGAGAKINIRKLIDQLVLSKRRIERKIGNTLLLEKQLLKRRVRQFCKG